MKILLLILATCFSMHFSIAGNTTNVIYDTVPQPIGYVNDFEGILKIDEILLLDSLIENFEDSTTIQIAIVTLDSSYTANDNFDDYILRIANIWGVGQATKNNGIVIGFSSQLRRIRIQNGYGIERIFSDAETKKVIDDHMVPNFKKAEYFLGLKEGLVAITEILGKKLAEVEIKNE